MVGVFTEISLIMLMWEFEDLDSQTVDSVLGGIGRDLGNQ